MVQDTVERLRQFYVAHRQALFSYALSITGATAAADDAIQNAFSRLLQRSRLPAELRPYVFRCIRNAALDERRQARREERNATIFNGRPEDPAALQFQLDTEQMLARLPDDEREVIVLKLYAGMTFSEIADTRSIPQGTAASLYRRGIEKLRAIEERENCG